MAAIDFEPNLIIPRLELLESTMSDFSYREAIKNSSTFNSRLTVERKHRIPFLDSQTGIAQAPSSIYFEPRQRLPGLKSGQIYSYPSKRWRKKRRQYLTNYNIPKRKDDSDSNDYNIPSFVENPSVSSNNEDSKDSLGAKDSETVGGKTPGGSRGRRKQMSYVSIDLTDTDKPFACDLCGARYKTRPGLTYHYTHSHKEGTSADVVSRRGGDSSSSNSRMLNDEENSSSMDGAPGSPAPMGTKEKSSKSGSDSGAGDKFQDSYLTFLSSPGAPTTSKKGSTPNKPSSSPVPGSTSMATSPTPLSSEPKSVSPTPTPTKTSPSTSSTSKTEEPPLPILKMEQNEKARAKPSPYCDFCLGDTVNKKSGQPEDLVSCSDCGRSGHPTCLQFTSNMKVSVRKYRWQCIECKCCSICGTSDNDDQLLFCDDCDRGYHMYCLVPPIQTPPEGSWSCRLCIKEFHKK